LRRERLHKGIFILPALIFAVPLFPMAGLCLALSFMHQKANEVVQQMQAQSDPSGLLYLPVLVLAIPWMLVFLGSFVSTLLDYLKSEVLLTNQRLFFRTGFIRRVSGELPLENIETIFLVEPILGRIFGFGTISLTSVGGARFSLRYMSAPQTFHASLQQAVAYAKTLSFRTKPPAQVAPSPSSTRTAGSTPKEVVKQHAPPAASPDDHSRFMPKN
ncbi:MAG: PH domain-containing protein, partial [Verrucomicrobiota bacterium]